MSEKKAPYSYAEVYDMTVDIVPEMKAGLEQEYSGVTLPYAMAAAAMKLFATSELGSNRALKFRQAYTWYALNGSISER